MCWFKRRPRNIPPRWALMLHLDHARSLDALKDELKEATMATAAQIQAAIDQETADIKQALAAIAVGIGNLYTEIQALKDSPVEVDLVRVDCRCRPDPGCSNEVPSCYRRAGYG